MRAAGCRLARVGVRAWVSVAAIATAMPAHADEREDRSRNEVVFDTSAQFYDVRSPSGETVLARRRLTSTIAARATDLVDRRYGELSFRARARFDADFGRGGEETNPNDTSSFVPGFARTGGDLMYAYLEGRKLGVDWFAFRLGRQYVTDALGFWSFDGGYVQLASHLPVALELYGGLEQRGGFPFSTSRYEAQGAYRGSRRGFDDALYPSFEDAHVAPAFGAGIETNNISFIHARATYRHVLNTGSFHPDPFSATTMNIGSRTSSERLGFSADSSREKVGAVHALMTYDLFRSLIDSARVSVDAFATKKLILGVDFEHLRPFYDGDSIWNFFAGEPTDTLSGRVSYTINDAWSASIGGGGRVFRSEEATVAIDERLAAQFPTTGHSFAAQGYAHLRHRTHTMAHGISTRFNIGEQGDRTGLDLFASRTIASRWLLDARGSAFHFRDRLREDRDATSLGLIASVGYRISERTTTTLEDQLETNRLIGVRNRFVVWLKVGVDP